MSKNLSGKVALVTGGSRGIGAATARVLAEKGAHVAISYSASHDKAEAVVRDLKKEGVRAAAFNADQANKGEVERLVAAVVERFGRLDILVNNAGVFVAGALGDPSVDAAQIDHHGCRSCGPMLSVAAREPRSYNRTRPSLDRAQAPPKTGNVGSR